MKIASVDVMINGKPGDMARQVFCRVNTDEGIYGYGEGAATFINGSEGVFSMLLEFSRRIIGMNPLYHEVVWSTLYSNTFWTKGNGAIIYSAVSAIDMALWDIKGKAAGMPIYQLLGGKHRDEHCVSIGKNSRGDEVLVNKEFMKCDVRIGIGCVSPHPMNGYGGGGKLIFPGLAHIDTTESNHRRREVAVPGDKQACGLRRDIEEMTKMIGTFFKIDVVMNAALDIIDLYAGDPVKEYYQAVESSSKANRLTLEAPKDIVFSNANAKYNEAFIAIKIGKTQLKPGGDIVIINHCAGGTVIHYLYGQAGKDIAGRCILAQGQTLPNGGRVICYTPYPGKNPQQWDMIQVKTLEEVMALLRERHGAGTTVSILSDGSISYFQ